MTDFSILGNSSFKTNYPIKRPLSHDLLLSPQAPGTLWRWWSLSLLERRFWSSWRRTRQCCCQWWWGHEGLSRTSIADPWCLSPSPSSYWWLSPPLGSSFTSSRRSETPVLETAVRCYSTHAHKPLPFQLSEFNAAPLNTHTQKHTCVLQLASELCQVFLTNTSLEFGCLIWPSRTSCVSKDVRE